MSVAKQSNFAILSFQFIHYSRKAKAMIRTSQSTDRLIHTTQNESLSGAAMYAAVRAGSAVTRTFFDVQTSNNFADGTFTDGIFIGWCNDIFANSFANSIEGNGTLVGSGLHTTNRPFGLVNALFKQGSARQDSSYLGSAQESVRLAHQPACKPFGLSGLEPRDLEPKTHRSREPWRIATVSI